MCNTSSFRHERNILFFIEQLHALVGPMKRNGFTLIELVIVILVLGVLVVSAAPRLFGGPDADVATIEARLMSTLRLAQQRAMSDTQRNCYGLLLSSNEAIPIACDLTIDSNQVITMPQDITLTVTSTTPGFSGGIYFNSRGCPVPLTHFASPLQCGDGSVQIQIGSSSRGICIQSQGYIRSGVC